MGHQMLPDAFFSDRMVPIAFFPERSLAHRKQQKLRMVNAASRIFLRPTPVAVATKFGTKWAITRLAQKIFARFICDWQYSMAHPQKPFYRRKNLAKNSYAS